MEKVRLIGDEIVNYLKQLLFQVINQKKVDKKIFKIVSNNKYEFIPQEYVDIIKFISKVYEEGKKVSVDYMAKKGFILSPTEMEQHEITNILEGMYYNYGRTRIHEKYNPDILRGDADARKLMHKELTELTLQLEDIEVYTTHDSDKLTRAYKELTNKLNEINIEFSGLENLGFFRKRVLGLMARTGVGKSFILQKIHAEAILKGYKVLHFSPELSYTEFMCRLFSQLGWHPLDKMDELSTSKFEEFVRRLKNYEKQYIVPAESGTFNLYKIEKMLNVAKPDMLIIDYLQKADENQDGATTKLATHIKTLTAMHNVCTVTGLQAKSDSGSDTTCPPLLHEVKWAKCVWDDFDTACSFHCTDNVLNFVTLKARHNNWIHLELEDKRNMGLYPRKNPSLDVLMDKSTIDRKLAYWKSQNKSKTSF